MIDYEPKDWWRGFLAVRGTVLPQVYQRVTGLALLTAALWAASKWIWPGLPALNPLAHTLMGVILGLLLVFRTNASYDRYWEGRRLWGGLVNASRNLVRGAAACGAPAEEVASLVGAYVRSVKQSLRIEPGEGPVVPALRVSRWINERVVEGRQNVTMGRLLETYLAAMVDCQGGCERIRTPIPFVYAIHLRHLMVAYLATLPFVLVPVMGWFAAPAVALVAFGLLGIEVAGLEIENPFGTDPNDLPLEDLCSLIERDAAMVASHAPAKSRAA